MKKKALVFLVAVSCLALNTTAAADEVLVKGALTQVSKEQFLGALQRMDARTQREFLSKENRVFKAVKNYYITEVALAQAKQSGLYDTPKMQALIEKAMGDAVLQEMYQAYLDKELAKKKFDGLAQDYYTVNKEQYKTAPEVDASHILIDYKTRSKEEAQALAEKIRQQLVSGEDFVTLAQQYSDDPSAATNHGRLGFFTKERMVKPFSDAAFALKESGDISPVVESDFGLHIIRLEAIKESGFIPFEQVKKKLIDDLTKAEVAKINERYKAELLDDQNIEINREAIQSLVTTSGRGD
ncbi:MAG: peptidylprolyl isomerase [Methylococcaceae bacterium]|nr:peptidylprolyl isomerase [Methylococcaceae bacterium]